MSKIRRAFSLVFGAAVVAALLLVFAFSSGVRSQVPTPPTPTVAGLGARQPTHDVTILNDSTNVTPAVTAYEVTITYANPRDGVFGAPANHFHKQTLRVVADVSG